MSSKKMGKATRALLLKTIAEELPRLKPGGVEDIITGRYLRIDELLVLAWMGEGLQSAIQSVGHCNGDAMDRAYDRVSEYTEIAHQPALSELLGTGTDALTRRQLRNQKLLLEFIPQRSVKVYAGQYFGRLKSAASKAVKAQLSKLKRKRTKLKAKKKKKVLRMAI